MTTGADIQIWSLQDEALDAVSMSVDERLLGPEDVAGLSSLSAASRARVVRRRSALKRICATMLAIPPERVSITRTRSGKPFVSSPATDLRFSVTHSRGICLIAIGRGRELGIDLEFADRELDACKLARRFFAREEADYLAALSPEQGRTSFLKAWTRKEALVKAEGRTLAEGLNRFGVRLTTEPELKLFRIGDRDWSFTAVTLPELPAHFCHVVAEGAEPLRTVLRSWP